MQHAHPTHKVEIYHISSLANGYLERLLSNVLGHSIFEGGSGFRGLLLLWIIGVQHRLRYRSFGLCVCEEYAAVLQIKPRKLNIERLILQWLLETLFQCLSLTRSVVFSAPPPFPSTPFFCIVHMFLRHLFISCRMDEVDRRREAIRQRRSARGLGSFLEVQTFLSTRHSRNYQERIRSELRELLLLESGTSNYWLDNCAARAAWHILDFRWSLYRFSMNKRFFTSQAECKSLRIHV